MECTYCKSKLDEWVVKCKHCWEFVDKKYEKTTNMVYLSHFKLSENIYCPECWYEGKTRKTWTENDRNILITILLLIIFFPVWIIYWCTGWKNIYLCPKCKNKFINKSVKK
jgi:hypothetical protein